MSDFSNLGEEIKNTVQNAVDSMNFDHLHNDISNSVNSTLHELRKSLNINGNKANSFDWKVSYDDTKNSNNQQNYNNQDSTTYSYDYKENNSKTQYYGESNAQYTDQTNTNAQAQMWEQRKQAAINRANQMKKKYANQYNAAASYAKQSNTYRNERRVVRYKRRMPGRVRGPLLKMAGYPVAFGTGLGLAYTVGEICMGHHNVIGDLIPLGITFSVAMLISLKGKALSNRVKRLKLYLAYFGNSKFCQIESLANHTGYSKKFLMKDIRKMMQLGMLPEAHMDEQSTCLILDDETYNQYLQTNAEYKRKQMISEEEKKEENKERQQEVKQEDAMDDSQESEDMKKTIAEGKEYIRQIKEANEAIPDVVISEKLSRLEQITSKIFSFVRKHPEQLPELRKFMSYYLPITLKLVNAYKELDAQIVQGDNITNSKNEIVKTLDMINFAFEKLFDSLYESTAMEVSSDISALEALFAQDGLTKKDFNIK